MNFVHTYLVLILDSHHLYSFKETMSSSNSNSNIASESPVLTMSRTKRRVPETSATTTTSSSKKPREASASFLFSSPSFISEQHLETVKAELEHERSLRLLDQKRFQQLQTRLEKQIEFAAQEASDATALLEELRTEHERTTQQLRSSRNQAMSELRHCQIQIEMLEQEQQNEETEESETGYWKQRCEELEAQLRQEKDTFQQQQNQQLQTLRQQMMREKEQEHDEQDEPKNSASSAAEVPSPREDARPALLTELNRVRVELADCRRQLRQSTAANQKYKEQHQKWIQHEQERKATTTLLHNLQKEQSKLIQECEEAKALTQTWKQFEIDLIQSLGKTGLVLKHETEEDPSPRKLSSPPEVSTVLRLLKKIQRDFDDMRQEKVKTEQECLGCKEKIQEQKQEIESLKSQQLEASREKEQLKHQILTLKRELDVFRHKVQIGQRECQGLRELIQTFDGLPLVKESLSGANNSSEGISTIAESNQVALKALQEELEVLTQQHEDLRKEYEASNKQCLETQAELDRVKEKFGKLREALYQEREKVEAAEARANEAERLAGKGSFNPDTTRVLHFHDSPLVEALRDEVKVLKRQIEAIKGEKPNNTVSSKQSLNAEKLNQRLKENFREQISRFREGVYLMTGYKVDMLPSSSNDKPLTFRVRSMFAEREEDHLLLQWPQQGDKVGSSLDIVATDFAKWASATPSYDYMTKFHSLPAFLASVQLCLFEKQTVLM